MKKINRFAMKYTETSAGWICFDLKYGSYFEDSYCFSYCFENPWDLILWAKEIEKGENGSFICDAEGWNWIFKYDGKNVIFADDKYDSENNPEPKEIIRIKFQYDRYDFCNELYRAFNAFMTDGTYKPMEWEGFDILELLMGDYNDYNVALSKATEFTYDEIYEKISKHPFSELLIPKLEGEFFTNNYDSLNNELKEELLEDLREECYNHGFSLLGHKA